MVDNLGIEITGMQQIFIQFCAFLTILEAGCGLAVAHCLYSPVEHGDYERASRILNGAKRIYSIIILLALLISCLGIYFILSNINFGTLNTDYIILCFALIILSFLIDYIYAVDKIILEVDGKLYKINRVQALIKIIDGITTLIMLGMSFGLISILLKSLFVNILIGLAISSLVKKYIIWYEKSKRCSYEMIYGMRSLLIQGISSAIIYNSSGFLLAKFGNMTDVVIYTTYFMLINLGQACVNAIPRSLTAIFGRQIALVNNSDAITTFNKGIFLTFLSSTIIGEVLFLNMEWFITKFFGQSFKVSEQTIALFILVFFLSSTRTIIGMVIISKGKFKDTTIWSLVEGIILIGSAILLIQSQGIQGILLSTVLAIFFGTYIQYSYIAIRYILKIKFKIYLYKLIALSTPIVIMLSISMKCDLLIDNIDEISEIIIINSLILIISLLYFLSIKKIFWSKKWSSL